MISDTRQEQILAYLKQHSTCGVKELAAALYVSDATIRRDLSEMQNLGLLKRSHGGAVLLERADETSIFIRMAENAKEKETAATRALLHLPSTYKTLFLDSSSTVLALAQRMELKGKTVVTNGLQTVQSLAKMREINLLLPGGSVSATGTSLVGSLTNKMLSDFHFDLMLTSCAAIGGRDCFETSLEQREIKRTVFERSDCRMLIADRSKLTRTATYRFCNLAQFDAVVFDKLSDEEKNNFDGINIFG